MRDPYSIKFDTNALWLENDCSTTLENLIKNLMITFSVTQPDDHPYAGELLSCKLQDLAISKSLCQSILESHAKANLKVNEQTPMTTDEQTFLCLVEMLLSYHGISDTFKGIKARLTQTLGSFFDSLTDEQRKFQPLLNKLKIFVDADVKMNDEDEEGECERNEIAKLQNSRQFKYYNPFFCSLASRYPSVKKEFADDLGKRIATIKEALINQRVANGPTS